MSVDITAPIGIISFTIYQYLAQFSSLIQIVLGFIIGYFVFQYPAETFHISFIAISVQAAEYLTSKASSINQDIITYLTGFTLGIFTYIILGYLKGGHKNAQKTPKENKSSLGSSQERHQDAELEV
jgi:hypothetical protein